MLRAIALHCAGGDSLYSGSALLLISLAWLSSGRDQGRRGPRISIAIAVLLMLVATVAEPWWILGSWVLAFCVWIIRQTTRTAAAVAGFTLLVVGMELWIVLRPFPRLTDGASIAIVGDSLSARQPPPDFSWPGQFVAQHGFVVHNFAVPGATVQSAMRQIDAIPKECEAVVVLIGGNDMLGETPASKFHRDIEELAGKLVRPPTTDLSGRTPFVAPSFSIWSSDTTHRSAVQHRAHSAQSPRKRTRPI